MNSSVEEGNDGLIYRNEDDDDDDVLVAKEAQEKSSKKDVKQQVRKDTKSTFRVRHQKQQRLLFFLVMLSALPCCLFAFQTPSQVLRLPIQRIAQLQPQHIFARFRALPRITMSFDEPTLSSSFSLNQEDEEEEKEENSIKDTNTEHTNRVDEYTQTYKINIEIGKIAKELASRRKQQYNHTPRQLTQLGSQALDLFQSLSNPDTVAYNSMLNVCAKVSPYHVYHQVPAVTVALELLEKMKQEHEYQAAQNQKWYDRLEQQQNENDNDNNHGITMTQEEISKGPPPVKVKPNVRTYTTVMDACSKCQTIEMATQAELLLQELQERFLETHDVALEPNIITYNTVLSAWSKVRGSSTTAAATRACHLLQAMPVTPDVISYNAVLHAIAKSGWERAGERAELLLNKMKKESSTSTKSNITPNARSYTTVMDAWGQSGQPDQAYAVLQQLLTLYQECKKDNNNINRQHIYKPNIISFSTVIHAYAISKDHADTKASKAYQIFQQLVNDYSDIITPNRVTYNNLLNCYATATRTPELLDQVEDLYQQVLADNNNIGGGPDQYTFGIVLKAAYHLLFWEANRHDFAPSVFQEAVKRGMVSSAVLWKFKQAVPIETYRQVVWNELSKTTTLNDDDDDNHNNNNITVVDQLTWHDLPSSWVGNVHGEKQKNQQSNHYRPSASGRRQQRQPKQKPQN